MVNLGMAKTKEISEHYLFTALDIATYIKWTQMSGAQEYHLIETFWEQRKQLLSKSSGSRFDVFKNRVYDELHKLWQRDFVNEFCPLSRALDIEKQAPAFLLPKEASLELYLKLMAIHLRLTEHLPFISMHWSNALDKSNISKPSKALWNRIVKALRALELDIHGDGFSTYTMEDFFSNKTAQLYLKG